MGITFTHKKLNKCVKFWPFRQKGGLGDGDESAYSADFTWIKAIRVAASL
jgi:hypothetical protein